VAAARGDPAAAEAAWGQVVADYPDDPQALQRASRLLFEKVGPAAAEGSLRAELRCDPENADALHNLGTIHLLAGRAGEAVEEYQASLRHRPGAAHTQVQLGHALQAAGRGEEAAAAWREALRPQPNHPDALAALRQVGRLHPAGAPAREDTAPEYGGKGLAARLQVRGPVDLAIARDLWERDVYGLRSIAEPPALVVDVGAHIGLFALLAAETWPAARVIACEADPDNAALLRRNVAGRPGIDVVEAAIVGADVPLVDLHVVVDKAGGNSGGGSCVRPEPGSKRVKVPALSAVRLWQSRGLDRCDLLKLDCEGAEPQILRALAEAGLLPRVRHVTGEWHAPDDRPGTTAAVRRELGELLGSTHRVTFNEPFRGREGHFHAAALQWPPG
jgi:FkbM family methyltransferase